MSAASLLSPSSVANQPSADAAISKTNPYADLTSSDFVKIMLSELSNQDPLKPNDSAALLEQMSSLRGIESSMSLQDSLKSLVLQNTIGQAGALIGKAVEGMDSNGQKITGTVTSVRITEGKAEVELDSGVSLGLDRVTSVTSGVATPTPVAPATPAVGVPNVPVAPPTTTPPVAPGVPSNFGSLMTPAASSSSTLNQDVLSEFTFDTPDTLA